MKQLYKVAGLTKQAHHKWLSKEASHRDMTEFYICQIDATRELHPRMGLEKIYKLVKPAGIGRDAFIELGRHFGYLQEPKRPRTTFIGPKSRRHPNLLERLDLRDINRVWVTDITYYLLKGTYYYISLMMDLYSRRIIGWKLGNSLEAKHSIATLRMALKSRSISKHNDLIHHSDKGVQYTSHAYTNLLSKRNIGISMCNSVFENTNMERANGRIKNDYLYPWSPKSRTELEKRLRQACLNYNNAPHGSLNDLSPCQMEEMIKNIPLHERIKHEIYTVKRSTKVNNPNQLELIFN